MRVHLLALFVLIVSVASCSFDEKCHGKLVYDDATDLCYECPMNAEFKNGTCECMDGFEYLEHRCVMKDGGAPLKVDAGSSDAGSGDASAAYTGKSCKDYCAFAKACIGMNALAPGVLPDIVSGLHANDAAACESSCKSDLGDKEASDEALACMVEAQPGAMCDAADPQVGLAGAFGAIGACCGPRKDNPLCKSICTPLKANPLTSSMVTFCN